MSMHLVSASDHMYPFIAVCMHAHLVEHGHGLVQGRKAPLGDIVKAQASPFLS